MRIGLLIDEPSEENQCHPRKDKQTDLRTEHKLKQKLFHFPSKSLYLFRLVPEFNKLLNFNHQVKLFAFNCLLFRFIQTYVLEQIK